MAVKTAAMRLMSLSCAFDMKAMTIAPTTGKKSTTDK
jgi:hypothetical protein